MNDVLITQVLGIAAIGAVAAQLVTAPIRADSWRQRLMWSVYGAGISLVAAYALPVAFTLLSWLLFGVWR